MKESSNLEFKRDITNTFLKTVCAFANYSGGSIVFGIDDDGKTIGLEDPKEACLSIENRINDSISPEPDYELQIRKTENTVVLHVKPGMNKPYFYKSKTYKRNDTATIELDPYELKRLILEGMNITFDAAASRSQELSFDVLEEYLKTRVGIKVFSQDTLRTLNLYSDAEGYNNAAQIMADTNDFSGIDMARFGNSISMILKRKTLDGVSALKMYEAAIEMFEDYYIYEIVSGAGRSEVEIIPKEAFREAIANALIHRSWDINTHIRVLMFEDRIEIVSPGGLPSGITESEYLRGNLSILRNPIIANIFFRLKFVEILGTGVLRIREAYRNSKSKPSFEFSDNMIKVILPATKEQLDLKADEETVYMSLDSNRGKAVSDIVSDTGFGRSKVKNILKELSTNKYVVIEGNQRGTKYRKV